MFICDRTSVGELKIQSGSMAKERDKKKRWGMNKGRTVGAKNGEDQWVHRTDRPVGAQKDIE